MEGKEEKQEIMEKEKQFLSIMESEKRRKRWKRKKVIGRGRCQDQD